MMNKYQNTTEQPIYHSTYSDKQFLHTFVAGAALPFIQASITAFVVMVGVVIMLYVFDSIDFVKPMIITGGLTFVVTWLALQRRWLKLTDLEKIFGTDLNDDGVVGEPKQIRIQLDEVQNGHIRQTQMFTLPCDEDELILIAERVRAGIPFSEKEWTGAGKPFSVSRFREIRSEMLKRQMLVPASAKSGKQGYVFTRAGQGLLNYYAPPPPLQE